jgi:hypothetical protein
MSAFVIGSQEGLDRGAASNSCLRNFGASNLTKNRDIRDARG